LLLAVFHQSLLKLCALQCTCAAFGDWGFVIAVRDVSPHGGHSFEHKISLLGDHNMLVNILFHNGFLVQAFVCPLDCLYTF